MRRAIAINALLAVTKFLPASMQLLEQATGCIDSADRFDDDLDARVGNDVGHVGRRTEHPRGITFGFGVRLAIRTISIGRPA